MRQVLCSAALCFAAVIASSQTPAPQPNAFDLLKHVAQRYADAKSYRITASEETTQTADFQRMWSKSVLAAVEAPGGRSYFRGQGNMGEALRISDGKTVWKYHVAEHHYTAQPANAANANGMVQLVELAVMNAQNLKSLLAGLVRTIHSASFSPEETLVMNGSPVPCLVIRIRDSDQNHSDPNAMREQTIWIDKQRDTIAKIEDRRDLKNVASGLSFTQVMTTTYTETELDGAIPDSLFTFVPPAETTLLNAFPDPGDNYGMPSLAGGTIPDLKFKFPDGKIVSIESLRGKPVLIDFWATWCAPCVAAMPKMAEIYKEGKDKGLVLLSVDEDEDAAKAGDFLQKRGYAWQNFHDGDGGVAKLMGSSPIPRVVLVDAKGQIVYDGTGGDENRVRTHIARLGPEFRDLAPKASPCDVAAR